MAMRRASAGAAAVVLVVLAGCGGGSSATSTSSLTTVKSPQRTQPANPPPSTVTTNPMPPPAPPTTHTRHQRPIARQVAKSLTPTKAVKLALTAADPLICRLYTPQLVQRSFGGEHGCQSAVTSGSRADSVEIVSSHPEGHHAVVVAVPHGGPSSAEKLTILLALARGGWRLDSIKSNAPVGP
jgi:hypothetical protein